MQSNRLLLLSIFLASLFFLSNCSDAGAKHDAEATGHWRDQVTRLRMGSRASEEDPIAVRRIELVQDYLENATGVPVKIYQAGDYNSIIQALSTGQIDISSMGAGSYSNVYAQIGEGAEPILVRRDTNGESGYYSTIVVKSDSPYYSIEDLEGVTLAFVDFNSTSGYIYPRWAMRQQGIDPDEFFGKVALAGGHLQAIMALENGQFVATVVAANSGNPQSGYANGTLRRLARRGMIDHEDYRIIWHAGPIPNSPYVIRSDLPQELRDLVKGAIAAMPYDAPEAHSGMARLPGSDYRAVNREFFDSIIAMREEEIKVRRERAIAGLN